MRKTAWPLYLTIAVAAASSMATSPPALPLWQEFRTVLGPRVQLSNETGTADNVIITAHVSQQYAVQPPHGWDEPFVDVYGVVNYEIEGEPQFLHISLLTPEQTVVADQVHFLEGAGQFAFRAKSYAEPDCAPAGAVCEQSLTALFDAGASVNGVIDIEWYVRAQAQGGEDLPPADLVLDLDVQRGQPVDESPLLWESEIIDEPGDGRWLLVYEDYQSVYLDPNAMSNSRHFIMRGAGSYASSLLSLVATIENGGDPAPAKFLLSVVPDESTGPVAERAVTLAGNSEATVELQIPQPLDCPAGRTCQRGYTIILDSQDEIPGSARSFIKVRGVVEGQGELPPLDTEVALDFDPVTAY